MHQRKFTLALAAMIAAVAVTAAGFAIPQKQQGSRIQASRPPQQQYKGRSTDISMK